MASSRLGRLTGLVVGVAAAVAVSGVVPDGSLAALSGRHLSDDNVVMMGMADGWVDVAAGGSHTCWIARAGGTAHCAGTSPSGAVGNSSPSSTAAVPDILLRPNLTQPGMSDVATGRDHSCALESSDGLVRCWGEGGSGQLGNQSTADNKRAVAVQTSGGDLHASAVAAGGETSCAIDGSGELWCWGENDDGEAGIGTTSAALTEANQTQTSGGSPVVVSAVAVGTDHTCAIRSADSVLLCWGSDAYGQVTATGTAGADVVNPAAVQVGGSGLVVDAVAAGATHTCAVRSSDQAVLCWGANTTGQLGVPADGALHVPQAVAGLPAAAAGTGALAAGTGHTCAIAGGWAWCWGDGMAGQRSDGATTVDETPTRFLAGSGFPIPASQVTAGDGHTCVLDAAAVSRCSGENSDGKLGDATTAGRTVADTVAPVPPNVTGVQVVTVRSGILDRDIEIRWDETGHPLVVEHDVHHCQGNGCTPAYVATVPVPTDRYRINEVGNGTQRVQVVARTSRGTRSWNGGPTTG